MPGKPVAKRGRGRPRTRPANSVSVTVPLSDAERQRVNAAADRAGVSAAHWMRATLVKASEGAMNSGTEAGHRL